MKDGWSSRGSAAPISAMATEIPADDGYWRVEMGIACGAARAAWYAACGLIAPDGLEPEFLGILLRPWREAVGLPAAVTAR